MSKRSSWLLADDILEAIEKIEKFTANYSRDRFIKDQKTIDAVTRNLEIIGEAAKRLPDVAKKKYPSAEWAKIIGLRHRIVHEYFGIDVEIVWSILEDDLPRLKKILQKQG